MLSSILKRALLREGRRLRPTWAGTCWSAVWAGREWLPRWSRWSSRPGGYPANSHWRRRRPWYGNLGSEMKSFTAPGKASGLKPLSGGRPSMEEHGPPPQNQVQWAVTHWSHPQLGPKPWVLHRDRGVTVPTFLPHGATWVRVKNVHVSLRQLEISTQVSTTVSALWQFAFQICLSLREW